MEQPPIDDAASASGASDDDRPALPLASPAEGSDAHGLATEAEEIRRLVDAGADSPEALRDLAARLREHRQREDSIWRAEVKPGLVKENKGRLRGHRTTSRVESADGKVSRAGVHGVLLIALLVIVVVAASTTVWVLIILVLGLLGFAWKQGRDATRARNTDPTR